MGHSLVKMYGNLCIPDARFFVSIAPDRTLPVSSERFSLFFDFVPQTFVIADCHSDLKTLELMTLFCLPKICLIRTIDWSVSLQTIIKHSKQKKKKKK